MPKRAYLLIRQWAVEHVYLIKWPVGVYVKTTHKTVLHELLGEKFDLWLAP